jgi:hypothetical protein
VADVPGRHTSPRELNQKGKVQARTGRGAGRAGRLIKTRGGFERGRQQAGKISHYNGMNEGRLIRCLWRRKLAASRDGPFATFVSIRRGKAFTLGTAVSGSACESASEAVHGPDKDHDAEDRERNVNATTHSAKG